MDGRRLLLWIAHRHRELELAERAHGSAGAVRDLDGRIKVHVSRAEVADRKGVAAEVHGIESVVHDQLRAHGVVHAGGENVWLFREQPAQPLAR